MVWVRGEGGEMGDGAVGGLFSTYLLPREGGEGNEGGRERNY